MDIKILQDLINSRQLPEIRKQLSEIQEADIAELLEDLDIRESLLVFRLLPKEIAAEVFSFLDVDRQSKLSYWSVIKSYLNSLMSLILMIKLT